MSSPEPGAPEAPRESAVSRIPGVFFSPVRTFESIARRPTWLAPLILWTLASAVVTLLVVPRMDFEPAVREAMEKRGQNVSEERMASIVESQKGIASAIGYASGFVAPTLVALLVALVYFGAFKAFGWDLRFKQSFGVTTHAFLPSVLGYLLAIPVIMRRERIDPRGMGDLVRSNLGFLVSRTDSPALYSLLSALDVFSFWCLALLVIGYAAAARVSRGKAAGIIVTIWALYVLGKAGWAAAFS